jgi:transcriptional regulator GlxA family with amidase domain
MPEPAVKTVAFVAYPGLTALDLVGPLQVFSALPRFAPEFQPVVVAETLQPVGTDTPLKLVPDKTFDEVPAPFGVLVPGGAAPTIRAMAHEPLLAYIRTAAQTAEFVASVCTGAMILAAVGLLQGREATTHWAFEQQLNRLGAHYQPQRWVEDGKFAMSAGVSAGIDLALHLVARLTGDEVARQIQLLLEYDPQPPAGPIDWDRVDRASLAPAVDQMLSEGLSDHPELLAKLRS